MENFHCKPDSETWASKASDELRFGIKESEVHEALLALKIGLEHAEDNLSSHLKGDKPPTRQNKVWEEVLSSDINKIKHSIKTLESYLYR